jgi:Predicted integral membrane protein (DUF2269)
MATNVTRRSRTVLVRADEPGLLLEDEIRCRAVRADEAHFATTDDDDGRGRRNSGGMSVAGSTVPAGPPRSQGARLKLRPGTRRVVLMLHVIAGVGLLGDVGAVLAVNIRAATTDDPGFAAASYELLAMFTVMFGIPLSLTALATGILLGLATPWGVLRYAWVTTKLVLLVGVILVGSLVLGPGTDAMRTGDGGAEARLIAGSAYDVFALTLATGLSVFKPRRRRRP